MLLHQRKDGSAGWIYRYTIHGHRREMGLGALRDVSLKQARELATGWALFYAKIVPSLKNVINKSMKQCAISIY
ncbi:SH3-like domain-containing protein [Bartonella silvatica]|uniref:SH3-like domain-containing protein n=1 Tax=Bartonella silvatica TaxID=357760 RepID=A0ABV2HHA2_9HYPH